MMVCAVTLISICSEVTKKPNNKCACVLINRVRNIFTTNISVMYFAESLLERTLFASDEGMIII